MKKIFYGMLAILTIATIEISCSKSAGTGSNNGGNNGGNGGGNNGGGNQEKDTPYFKLLGDTAYSVPINQSTLIDSCIINITDNSWQWDLMRGLSPQNTPIIGQFYWIDDSSHITIKSGPYVGDSSEVALNWTPPYKGKYFIRIGAQGTAPATVQLNPQLYISKDHQTMVGPGCVGAKVTFQ